VKTKTIIKCCAGILLSLLLLLTPKNSIPWLDKQADAYFENCIGQAALAYSTCRIMNGSISVLQESQLQVEPAGIGLSIAIGQALDPINDMIERTSDVLVTSIVSLGVQKLLFEISITVVPKLVGILLLLLSISVVFKDPNIESKQSQLIKIVLLLVVVRLCLPASSLTSAYLNRTFFEPKITEAKTELNFTSQEINKFTDFSLPQVDGIKKTIDNSSSFIKTKSAELKNAFASLLKNANNIVHNLLRLTLLYIGLFIIQIILLPILMFWVMAKTTNAAFSTKIPTIIHHRSKESEADLPKA
jgi:hypothetical protein